MGVYVRKLGQWCDSELIHKNLEVAWPYKLSTWYDAWFQDYCTFESDDLGLIIDVAATESTAQVTAAHEFWNEEEPTREHLMDMDMYLGLVGL